MKVFSIDVKKDADAIALGAAAMFALMIIPGVSGFIFDKIITPIRTKIGGK